MFTSFVAGFLSFLTFKYTGGFFSVRLLDDLRLFLVLGLFSGPPLALPFKAYFLWAIILLIPGNLADISFRVSAVWVIIPETPTQYSPSLSRPT